MIRSKQSEAGKEPDELDVDSAAGPAPLSNSAAAAKASRVRAARAEQGEDSEVATAGKEAETTEEIEGATLWAKDEEGNDLPPGLEDISQGGVNDCFLFASMAAIVNTDPGRIQNMIQDHGNGSYTVTFRGIGFFKSATQTVTADFVVGRHGNVRSRNAMWPLIIEKAYAQEKGGLDELDEGGNPGTAVEDLTNDGPSRFNPADKSADAIIKALAAAKEEQHPATVLAPKKDDASTEKKELADETGVYFWHAYTILDVDEEGKRIKLFNPWGRSHPNGDGWVSADFFRSFFIEVNIND